MKKEPLCPIRYKCDNVNLSFHFLNHMRLSSFGIFLGLIVTGEACLILCVYLSINSRHLTALIGSEQPGLGRRWPAADFCPMNAQYFPVQ